jgi:hypothetical protein
LRISMRALSFGEADSSESEGAGRLEPQLQHSNEPPLLSPTISNVATTVAWTPITKHDRATTASTRQKTFSRCFHPRPTSCPVLVLWLVPGHGIRTRVHQARDKVDTSVSGMKESIVAAPLHVLRARRYHIASRCSLVRSQACYINTAERLPSLLSITLSNFRPRESLHLLLKSTSS